MSGCLLAVPQGCISLYLAGGVLFLGQRGPLNERGIREIIARLGHAAKLPSPLGSLYLRHTFARSLLDPAAYGLDRPPMPLPAIQQLLGYADIATTTS